MFFIKKLFNILIYFILLLKYNFIIIYLKIKMKKINIFKLKIILINSKLNFLGVLYKKNLIFNFKIINVKFIVMLEKVQFRRLSCDWTTGWINIVPEKFISSGESS